MKALVFVQEKNREGRHDATGAFLPESKRFVRFHALGDPVYIDEYATGKNHSRTEVFDALDKARGLDVIAYFGHGTPYGLPSARIQWKHLRDFAAKIQTASSGPCRILLYACSAGKYGYFGSTLQKVLGPAYMVIGHTTAGHTTTNPNVTRYPAEPGQEYIIAPNSRLWQPWFCALKCVENTTLWMRFPFMTQQQIEAELEAFDYEALTSHSKYCKLKGSKPKRKQAPMPATQSAQAVHARR